MIETLSILANKLLNNDPLQTEIYFLEYGVDLLADIMAENALKRNDMVFLLYCFVQTTTNSHLRILSKIRDKVLNRNAYMAILGRLLLYESQGD